MPVARPRKAEPEKKTPHAEHPGKKRCDDKSLLIYLLVGDVCLSLLSRRIGIGIEPIDGTTNASQGEDDLSSVSPEHTPSSGIFPHTSLTVTVLALRYST